MGADGLRIVGAGVVAPGDQGSLTVLHGTEAHDPLRADLGLPGVGWYVTMSPYLSWLKAAGFTTMNVPAEYVGAMELVGTVYVWDPVARGMTTRPSAAKRIHSRMARISLSAPGGAESLE